MEFRREDFLHPFLADFGRQRFLVGIVSGAGAPFFIELCIAGPPMAEIDHIRTPSFPGVGGLVGLLLIDDLGAFLVALATGELGSCLESVSMTVDGTLPLNTGGGQLSVGQAGMAGGLMLVGMLAALASTVDTHLNWGASYWTNDVYRRFICQSWLKRAPTNRALVWVARGSNLLIVAIALCILPWLSSIQMAWQVSLLLGAGMGVLLVGRWIWWRITAWGELACIITSIVLAPLLLWGLPNQEEWRLLIMGIGSGVIGVGVSLFTKEDHDRLENFYRRAQPPGFWGLIEGRINPTAPRSFQRFWRAVLAMGLAALSIFCLLTGVGSWMVGSPPPPWLPWPAVWIAALLAVGTLLCPFWIKLGFPQSVFHRQLLR